MFGRDRKVWEEIMEENLDRVYMELVNIKTMLFGGNKKHRNPNINNKGMVTLKPDENPRDIVFRQELIPHIKNLSVMVDVVYELANHVNILRKEVDILKEEKQHLRLLSTLQKDKK